PYPAPDEVFFTGPAGSTLVSTPASPDNSGAEEGDAWYQSPSAASPVGAPAGTWTVNYRGTNMTFVKDLQPLPRLVVAVPTVTVENGLVQSVSWIYRDRTTGEVLSAPPAFMQSIQVQIEGQNGRVYGSPWDWDPAQTVHVLSSPVTWSTVRGLNMGYDDWEGNHYVLFFMRQ
ncbi:MAG TPA: hypothetical protein VN673_18235, partial [Clostridia bacterium]|nr:hypothetical protein [Clostridia bacterium]